MGVFVNRVGMKYGNLLVTVRASSSGRPKWECICDCGNRVVVSSSNLATGNSTSCGCARDRSVKKEMIGKKYGRLTVKQQLESASYGKSMFARYKCVCECGKEIATLGMSLRNGDTVSCVCAYAVAGAKRKKPLSHHRADWQFRNKRRRAVRLRAHRPFDSELFDLIEKEAYDLSRLRSEQLGVRFEVDHIIPLQSRLVCGLHNEFNLRVITAKENNAKGNRYWPDMPTGD